MRVEKGKGKGVDGGASSQSLAWRGIRFCRIRLGFSASNLENIVVEVILEGGIRFNRGRYGIKLQVQGDQQPVGLNIGYIGLVGPINLGIRLT